MWRNAGPRFLRECPRIRSYGSPGVNTVEIHFQQPPRTGLLIGRRVFGAPARSDAVLWEDGVITAIGPAAELSRRIPAAAPVVELPGAVITPGFIDARTHFAQWAL